MAKHPQPLASDLEDNRRPVRYLITMDKDFVNVHFDSPLYTDEKSSEVVMKQILEVDGVEYIEHMTRYTTKVKIGILFNRPTVARQVASAVCFKLRWSGKAAELGEPA